MLHSSTNTGMYIWCPNLFPRHFLWNTKLCTQQLTQAYPTMHCIHLVVVKLFRMTVNPKQPSSTKALLYRWRLETRTSKRTVRVSIAIYAANSRNKWRALRRLTRGLANHCTKTLPAVLQNWVRCCEVTLLITVVAQSPRLTCKGPWRGCSRFIIVLALAPPFITVLALALPCSHRRYVSR